ncbi:MAG TPA: glycosyltransferase family 2 protein [Azospirillaceae bacterium]|nr:glycosyltransferase family 2 protein [Azospirillaceae bacterium]
MIPVSVIILTRNEEACLPACLEALAGFAEVFVVDSDSTDATSDIARRHGAVVVPFRWDGRYPKKKQWSLENLPLRRDWVLFIDADEVVTPALAREIAGIMRRGPERAGYFIEGKFVFLGQPLHFGHHNAKLALFDRRRGRFQPAPDLDVAAMWEVEGHYQPMLDGPAGRLKAFLWHHDRKPFAAWLDRHNRYSDWEAALRAEGRMETLICRERGRRRIMKALVARLPFRPLAAFVHSYLWCLGFLDGAAGLHFALARAFYYWQIGVKLRERRGGPR